MNDIILYGDNMKINNKEFLNYIVAKETSNISFIKAIKINKKSISIKLNNDSEKFVFNNFFTKQSLYNMVIRYLSLYIKDNNIDTPNDIDYLKYKYSKVNYI